MGARAELKAQTRQAIVKNAAALFGRYGYDETGMRDIAAACGLSTGAIFANFTSKADVLRAVLEGQHGDPLARAALALQIHGHVEEAAAVRRLIVAAAA